MLDSFSNKVLDFQVVHVKEVSSSNAMEKEAFKRSVDTIRGNMDLDIHLISTDRHTGIKKLMRSDQYNDIIHQFDAWHVAKNITKKLANKAKKRDFNILSRWSPSIINHLYWSIATCNGNGKELVERFTSVLHHVVNRHEFIHYKYYTKCDHEPLSASEAEKKEWMKIGSPAHNALRDIIMQPVLIADLEKLTLQINTTTLEVFHSKKIRILPKSVFFEYEKMIAGAEIAALDHNHNVNRKEKWTVDEEGNPKKHYNIAWSKRSKRFVGQKVKESKSHDYIRIIMARINRKAELKKKVTERR